MMVKVKICGITNVSDALMAARAGADALGFNFSRGSPRYIPPEKAKPIVLSLPPFVAAVGVFVDSPPDLVREVVEFCGLQFAQLHGHETPRRVERLAGIHVLKTIRVASEADIRKIGKYRVDGFVLDSYVKGKPGGTGESFDWTLARAASSTAPIILAGGLRPDNVAEAIRTVRPYGVDTASGVESAPGQKSKELVLKFIRAAKSVDL